MPAAPPVPCPVRLGVVRTEGLPAQLHRFTRERNVHKVEKLLKKGVDVDSVNSFGQTPLFCASLLGFTAVVELLLQYGADPNHRCDDRSTPVHAAVFSSNPWLLSELLDAGGDLRLHDDQGRMPRDWADAAAQEQSSRMLDFLKNCVSHVRSLSQTHSPKNSSLTPTSCKTLLRSPSLLELLRPGGSDRIVNRKLSTKFSLCDTVQCFGFGKLCVEKAVGFLASVPLISDSELSQAEDEALLSFACGSYVQMTNYSWKLSRVTVKELRCEKQHSYQDLLITELQYCCRLFHPHLLQLMAVSMPSGLDQSRLVYERVHVGSLYTLLYHKRLEFPFLSVCELLLLVLQVCDALLYLHGRLLVLRSLSSHSVVIVHPGVAKITNLGFMVPCEGAQRCPASLPLPATMYNWAAPEVIRRKTCTGKADLYSICALIQELYTNDVPWGSVDPHWIKQAVDAGQGLAADPAVPQPYYDLLLKGLNPQAQDRTCSLQDLRYLLRSDLSELEERERRDGARPLVVKSGKMQKSPEIKDLKQPDRQLVYQEVQDELQHLDSFLEAQTLYQAEALSSSEELQDLSIHNNLPLDEGRLSPCPSSDKEQEERVDPQYLTTQAQISEHIRSVVLNLKVSQVLIQEAESSLETAEPRMEGHARSSCPQFDEVDGPREREVEVLKAVGPPPTYRPCLDLQEEEEEEISYFCSAEDESLNKAERDGMMSGRQQGVRISKQCIRSQWAETQEVLGHRAEPEWTSEVRAAVARMAWGSLDSKAGASEISSDSETAQEQLRPLLDTQNTSKLELLFKSFTGIQSESEQSTDFHTVTMPSAVWEYNHKDSSETEYPESPVEPSSIFYTPTNNLQNTEATEEQSQTLSSEEDLDVTMEVCHPNSNIQAGYRECQPAAEEPGETEPESVPRPTHTTRNSHMADIAELSSITCSPTRHLEWVGQEGAPSPHSTRFPPFNSTPRSPGIGCGTPQRKVHVYPLVPYLESIMETSPLGSGTSRSCTDAYNTAKQEDTGTVSRVRESPQEGPDTPPTGNPEITNNYPLPSSRVKHATESSNQSLSEAERAEMVRKQHEEECEEQEEVMKLAESLALMSSDEPPGAVTSGLIAVREDEEEFQRSSDTQQQAERDRGPPVPDVLASPAASNPPEPLEETKRAHSTLDEVLQGLQDSMEAQELSERPEDQAELRKPEEEGEARKEECRCPAGDHSSDGASWKPIPGAASKRGAKHEAWNRPHRVIVLEPPAMEAQRDPDTGVTLEPSTQTQYFPRQSFVLSSSVGRLAKSTHDSGARARIEPRETDRYVLSQGCSRYFSI